MFCLEVKCRKTGATLPNERFLYRSDLNTVLENLAGREGAFEMSLVYPSSDTPYFHTILTGKGTGREVRDMTQRFLEEVVLFRVQLRDWETEELLAQEMGPIYEVFAKIGPHFTGKEVRLHVQVLVGDDLEWIANPTGVDVARLCRDTQQSLMQQALQAFRQDLLEKRQVPATA